MASKNQIHGSSGLLSHRWSKFSVTAGADQDVATGDPSYRVSRLSLEDHQTSSLRPPRTIVSTMRSIRECLTGRKFPPQLRSSQTFVAPNASRGNIPQNKRGNIVPSTSQTYTSNSKHIQSPIRTGRGYLSGCDLHADCGCIPSPVNISSTSNTTSADFRHSPKYSAKGDLAVVVVPYPSHSKTNLHEISTKASYPPIKLVMAQTYLDGDMMLDPITKVLLDRIWSKKYIADKANWISTEMLHSGLIPNDTQVPFACHKSQNCYLILLDEDKGYHLIQNFDKRRVSCADSHFNLILVANIFYSIG